MLLDHANSQEHRNSQGHTQILYMYIHVWAGVKNLLTQAHIYHIKTVKCLFFILNFNFITELHLLKHTLHKYYIFNLGTNLLILFHQMYICTCSSYCRRRTKKLTWNVCLKSKVCRKRLKFKACRKNNTNDKCLNNEIKEERRKMPN